MPIPQSTKIPEYISLFEKYTYFIIICSKLFLQVGFFQIGPILDQHIDRVILNYTQHYYYFTYRYISTV